MNAAKGPQNKGLLESFSVAKAVSMEHQEAKREEAIGASQI